MFQYRNEAAFSKAVCKLLRDHHWFVQRIETGTTGKGVPDLFTVSPKLTPIWIELKRVHSNVDRNHAVYIPWRPGQQSWMHNLVSRYAQHALTLACFNNMILVIPHHQIYKENRVWYPDPEINACFKLVDLV